jgi:hypothetical protein
LIGIFVFLVGIIDTKLGIDKHSSSNYNPITWTELYKCIPLLAFLSIAASVATYLYRSHIMKHDLSDYSIYIKCEKVYRSKRNVKAENMMICKCGGTVANLNRVKWVDT